MTLSSITPESLLTKTFQGGLLAAMPATLYALGGPFVLWNNYGMLVKICLAPIVLPSVICAPGALESCVRTTCIGLKVIGSSNTPASMENKKAFNQEFRRAKGMIRATLFPVSGWAVVAQLPVHDYYVYLIPKKGLETGCTAISRTATAVNRVLTAIKFWDCVEFTFNHTAVPVFNHVVTPAFHVVEHVATGAINLLRTSLGMR